MRFPCWIVGDYFQFIGSYALLYHEFHQCMNEELPISNNTLINSPNFCFVPFDEVENEFKLLFYGLINTPL